MGRILIGLLLVLLAALALLARAQQPAQEGVYPDLGPAPELKGDVWLNSAAPLRLAGLRGQVVLVDMWTFG
jgi:hypothetical protein